MAASDKISLNFHPEAKFYLEWIAKNHMWEGMENAKDAIAVVEICRNSVKTQDEMMRAEHSDPDYIGSREEVLIPSCDVPGGIPVYVYKLRDLPTDAPILIYFHGGGNIMGSRDYVDDTCKMLSSEARCVVVNVEYRLAPEHKFPAMMDDAKTATQWVLANRTAIGGTERSKVGVSGDSCGGQIAASTAHTLSGLDFQILIYPYLGGNFLQLPSYKDIKDDSIIKFDLMTCIETVVVYNKEDLRDPRYAVLLNEKYHRLPPTLLIVAEFDAIRDDSYEYLRRLTAAGVESSLSLAAGAIHGFYTQPRVFQKLCRDSYAVTSEFIRRFN